LKVAAFSTLNLVCSKDVCFNFALPIPLDMGCCTCGKMGDSNLKKVVFHVGKRVPDRLILL